MADLTIDPVQVRPLTGSITSMMNCAVEITNGNRLVYVSGEEEVSQCDADDADTLTGRIGFIVAGHDKQPTGKISAKERVTVLWFGRLYLGPDVALDVAKQYFASATPGGIADTAGTVTRRLGAPETSTIFFFNPDTVAASS